MKHLDPKIRISLYIVVGSVGAVLAAWGVVTQDMVDAILPVVAGVLAVSGGVTAVRNITPEDRGQGPALTEWIGIGRDSIPQILHEIHKLRDDIAQGTVTPTDGGLPVYDQPSTGVYVGQHRLVE